MGLLDKFKEKSRGVASAVQPEEGVEAQPAAEGDHEATGATVEASSEAGTEPGGTLSAEKTWRSGQQWGTWTEHVISWGGRHRTEGGADESGYEFSWSDLRQPVIEAVTGAGWTYRPK